MKIETGQTAPDFTLYNSEKKQVTLSDLRDKNVLLLFFPLAFTSVCTEELCNIRDNISFYNDTEATVLGISVDSLYTLAKYKEEQRLNFHLLSDFNKEVSSLYGSLYEQFGYNMKGVSKRSAFIIDKKGIIEYAEVLDKASEIPNFVEINSVLSKLK